MEIITEKLEWIFEERGDQLAICMGDVQFSYFQLRSITNALIKKYEDAGIKSDRLVAIHLNDPLLTIVSIVALYRMGCPYLPLDPAYPVERIKYMAENANAGWVICDSDFNVGGLQQVSLQRSDFRHEFNPGWCRSLIN